MKDTMSFLALKWAKISKKAFDAAFLNLEEMTRSEVASRHDAISAVYNDTFAKLMKVWESFPPERWENLFILKMHHLPEYKDLRRTLVAFKDQFMNRKKDDNAPSDAGQTEAQTVS